MQSGVERRPLRRIRRKEHDDARDVQAGRDMRYAGVVRDEHARIGDQRGHGADRNGQRKVATGCAHRASNRFRNRALGARFGQHDLQATIVERIGHLRESLDRPALRRIAGAGVQACIAARRERSRAANRCEAVAITLRQRKLEIVSRCGGAEKFDEPKVALYLVQVERIRQEALHAGRMLVPDMESCAVPCAESGDDRIRLQAAAVHLQRKVEAPRLHVGKKRR